MLWLRRDWHCRCLAGLAQAETLDRIAVSVGQEVITESQVILDLRVAAFLDQQAGGFERRGQAPSRRNAWWISS